MGVADTLQRRSRVSLRPALEHARPIYRALRQHRLGTHAAAIAAYVLGASAVFLIGVEIDEAGRSRDD
jgi:hypothetical protein